MRLQRPMLAHIEHPEDAAGHIPFPVAHSETREIPCSRRHQHSSCICCTIDEQNST